MKHVLERQTEVASPRIARCEQIPEHVFNREYVGKRPVIISGALNQWEALRKWSPRYFNEMGRNLEVPVKEFTTGGPVKSTWKLGQYCDFLHAYEAREGRGTTTGPPPYCHDIPIFELLSKLVKDVTPFPAFYLPPWYRYKWWRYVQFFLGPPGTLTPLHFDCLLTHNLFFQICGRKRFVLIDPKEMSYCYRRGWRWFDVDPENPDFIKHPLFTRVKPAEVIIQPGDILYMPPGTIHFVRSLDLSISFNVDWHTPRSSIQGVTAMFRGMPMRNVYYNFVTALGLCLHVSPKVLFPFYKSYLNYIS
jgi:hypothetical protein